MSLVTVLVPGLWILSCLAVFSLELMSWFLVSSSLGVSVGLLVSPPMLMLWLFSSPHLVVTFRPLVFAYRLWEFPGVFPLVQLSLGSAAAPGDLREYSYGVGPASCGASVVSFSGSRLCEH